MDYIKFEKLFEKIQRVLEKLFEIDKDQMNNTFRIIEKITKNDTKKIEEMKKIIRALYVIAFLLFLIFMALIT